MARSANLTNAVISMTKGPFFEKRIQVKQTSDGMVALLRGEDGNAYVVQISAAQDSKLKSLFKKELEKK